MHMYLSNHRSPQLQADKSATLDVLLQRNAQQICFTGKVSQVLGVTSTANYFQAKIHCSCLPTRHKLEGRHVRYAVSKVSKA